MNLSTAVEVAISLAFVYIFLSLICLGVSEVITRFWNLRSRGLANGIKKLLGSEDVKLLEDVVGQFMPRSPRTEMPSRPEKNLHRWLPGSIPNRTFALAFIQAVARDDTERRYPLNGLRDRVAELAKANPRFRPLLAALDEAQAGKEAVVKAVEKWFDEAMVTATEWYRRNIQLLTFVLAGVVTIALNADTLVMARVLWHDSSMRTAIVAAAEEQAKAFAEYDSTIAQLDSTRRDSALAARRREFVSQAGDLRLPIGWTDPGFRPNGRPGDAVFWPLALRWVLKGAGWLVTAAAVSLGAPFWFDLLMRLTGLKAALKKKEESRE